jgi:hypothetical protein
MGRDALAELAILRLIPAGFGKASNAPSFHISFLAFFYKTVTLESFPLQPEQMGVRLPWPFYDEVHAIRHNVGTVLI